MVHLIHPAVVHFAVASLVAGGLVEIWGLLRSSAAARRFGGTLVVTGTLLLVPTLATGYLAANTLELDAEAHRVLDGHEKNAWFVLGLFALALFWKGWHRGEIPDGQRLLYAGLLLAAVLLVAYSAMLGGNMVYVHGVGVG